MDSGGVEYPNPRGGSHTAQRQLRRWQRAQARRTPGGHGWWEAQRRIDRTHRRVAGLQSRALSDAGMSGLLSQIQYKAQWYGTQVVEADQWYPSSKTCSDCGVVNEDLGREREWNCPNCGAHHDRNQNAARNLRKLALFAVGEDVTLPDGEALAGGDTIAGEAAPDEGRTKPMTTAPRQLQLAL